MKHPAPVSFIGQAAYKVVPSAPATVPRPATSDTPNNAPAAPDKASWLNKNRDVLIVGILSSLVASWLALRLFGRR